MGSLAARLILHTGLFFPSIFIWAFGGWLVALIIALWGSGHYEMPLSGCLMVIFYPFVGWWFGVANVWGEFRGEL